MNKDDLKRVIDKLEPDNEMKYRLSVKLRNGLPHRISFKTVAVMAAGLVLIFGTGVLANYKIFENANANLGLKTQNSSTNPLIALLPDNPPSKSEADSPNNTSVHSNPLPPVNNSTSQQEIDSSKTNTDQSNTPPPVAKPNDPDEIDNTTTAQPENNTPDRSTNISNPLPPVNTLDPNPQLGSSQKNGTDSPEIIAPKNAVNLSPRPMSPNNLVDSTKTQVTGSIATQSAGIYIPQAPLPTNTKLSSKMMGLIVYQGRIYLQNSSQIDQQQAEQLVSEKLGTTTGNITEWSKQADTAVDLASTIGTQDVYTVKGYDKSFRIMTYEKINGEVSASFFECLNGLTVNSGNDIFGKFKMENNIATVQYENFDSWNNGKGDYHLLTKLDGFNTFLAALEKSIPYSQDSLADLLDDQSAADQRFLSVHLNDGSSIQLRLFKEGYVYYNGINIFFKVDSPSFAALWSELN
ncbi:MAG: hypothetical protein P4L69_22790 [Desulfosporosinus sp.]|nr:hypothetical protein [Desulfosporosinus sp.]